MIYRGTVLTDGRAYWLVWTSDRRPICMLIQSQFKIRSRWDYRLQDGDFDGVIPGSALIVLCREAKAIDAQRLQAVGTITPAALSALEMTLRRAAESEATERRQRLSSTG